MSISLALEILTAYKDGRQASDEAGAWVASALGDYIDGDDIALSSGLTVSARRSYWLTKRNHAALEAWTLIAKYTDNSNRGAAFLLYDLLCEMPVDLEEELVDLVITILDAGSKSSHFASGQSLYNVVVSQIREPCISIPE